MSRSFKNSSLAIALLLSAAPLFTVHADAKASFMQECSAKWKAAKAAGTVADGTKWPQRRRVGYTQLQKIRHERPPVLGQDALRMKLDAPDRVFLVSYAHDFAFVRFRRDLQTIGNRVALDHQ